jgi:hypothetical protein
LTAAIRAITEDERMRSHAAEVGEEIRAEDGVSRAVEIVGGNPVARTGGSTGVLPPPAP